MKKVLFTFFAVVGFIIISVANNYVEVKTLQVEEVLVVGDPCVNDQIAAYEDCISNGCDREDARWHAFRSWGDCMSGKGIWE